VGCPVSPRSHLSPPFVRELRRTSLSQGSSFRLLPVLLGPFYEFLLLFGAFSDPPAFSPCVLFSTDAYPIVGSSPRSSTVPNRSLYILRPPAEIMSTFSAPRLLLPSRSRSHGLCCGLPLGRCAVLPLSSSGKVFFLVSDYPPLLAFRSRFHPLFHRGYGYVGRTIVLVLITAIRR